MALVGGNGAIGQKQPVALALRDHESNLVEKKLAGLAEVVDFASSIKKVDRDPDGFFEQ